MVMRDACSFDYMLAADLDERFQFLSGLLGTIVAARNGNGIRIASLGDASKLNLASHATYGAAFAWKFDAAAFLSTPRIIFDFMDGSADQISLAYTVSGQVQVLRGATVLGTSGIVLIVGTMHHIQFQATINNTTGSYEVKVDGVSVLSGTGVNTRNGTAVNQANGYRLGAGGSSSGGQIFDDLYVWDGSGSVNNTFPGDVVVSAILPSGAGNSTQWTPSAGSNYQCVDETTPNTSDYVSTLTLNNKDTYVFGDVAGSGSPLGAVVNAYATKADAGAARGIKAICRASSTESQSSEVTISTTWRYWIQAVFENDPSTSALWASLAAINGAEWGVQVTT